MKAETLLKLMESGEYDAITCSEFARIYREQLAQLLDDEVEEDERLTAEDIKYEIASQRAGELI